MPYIPQSRRDEMMDEGSAPQSPGDLNYVISTFCDEYVETMGLSYQSINDVMGTLACVQQEFYRRVAVAYEREKCIINGEVFTTATDRGDI